MNTAYGHGPRFKRGEGSVGDRLGSIEDYLIGHDQWGRTVNDSMEAIMADHGDRIGKSETKIEALYRTVGEMKVRLGFIILIAGGLGGLIAAVVAEWVRSRF